MTSSNESQIGTAYICLLLFVLIPKCGCNQIYDNHRRPCHSADASYQHGEVYTRERSTVCLRYKCDSGHEILIDTKCRDASGQCLEIGQTVRHAQCVQLTCTMSGGYVSLKTTTRECAFKGQCVKVNQVVTDGCLSYRCTQVMLGEDKFRLGMELEGAVVLQVVPESNVCQDASWEVRAADVMLTTYGCPHPDNRGCLSLGQTMKCGSLICELRENLIGFYPVKSVCEDRETGRCFDLNATWSTKECVTLRCEAAVFESNKYATRIVPVSRGCPDKDNKCHEPDGVSLFPMTVQGQLRKCVCQKVQDTVQYSCVAGDPVTY